VLIPATPSFLLEFDDADLPGLVVCYQHLAYLLDIHVADDEVLDLSVGSQYAKVLSCSFKPDMLQAIWYGFEMTPTQAHLCVSLHPKLVIIRRSEGCSHRWMVADLFAKVFEL